MTSSASTVLIVFVGATLFLFAWLRVHTVARVIQMNMEIALIMAHVCLICAGAFKLYEKTVDVSITRSKCLKHKKVYILKNSVGNNLKGVFFSIQSSSRYIFIYICFIV